MTAQSRTVLKSYFQKGLRPTQSQYGDLIDSFELVSGATTDFLPLTGGIMTGAIQMPGVPTSALAVATKGYVDAIVSAGGAMAGGSNGQIQYNNSGGFGGMTVSGDAASLATSGVLTLAATGVSAGTYALATVTVDAKGRVTSASSGSSTTAIKTVKKQIFTGSGTYTPSSGMVYCIAEVVGGGGAGGGSGTANFPGGGGGAGGYGRSVISAATIGSSQSVTIGAAGVGSSGSVGGDGGTSSLGALISCTGGGGGAAGASATAGNSVAGGAGGTSSSADINISGGGGGAGLSGLKTSGAGGNCIYGAGGIAKATSAIVSGSAGLGYGAGGGGACTSGTSQAGGDGAAGIVIITEFCTV